MKPLTKSILLAAAFSAFLAIGIAQRIHASAVLTEQTAAIALPTVSVQAPQPTPAIQELVVPGDVQALQETPIYARTNGYLRNWKTDIGTRVKAGALLAEIDVPELGDQLRQAHAGEQSAQADADLAQVTAARYQQLVKGNAVSQQDTQVKSGEAQMKAAALAAAKANTERLTHLQSYVEVRAPFDGVITTRNVDVGTLIDAGAARPLFAIAKIDKLRVYVEVPQDYSANVKNGMPGYLSLAQYPGRKFAGVVVRNANAIDPVARTLRVELDVDNQKGELLPGSYAQVHLELSAAPGFSVPAGALIFGPAGVQVAVVSAGDTLLLKPVILGRDFGSRVEIAGGLAASDPVVTNPADSAFSGMKVKVVKPLDARDKS
jgi:membrane fusion protein (multidrug efflux system)